MTATEQAKLIGRRGRFYVGNLVFFVRVTDVKQAYGRTLVLVKPEAGDRSKWIALESLSWIEG